ncbi:MAG: E3 binding domain-containing protein [Alphaproteobacteria bacterium]
MIHKSGGSGWAAKNEKKDEAPKKAEAVAAPADDPKMSPAVRKMIGDNDLDAASIPASGKDGRLTKRTYKALEQKPAGLLHRRISCRGKGARTGATRTGQTGRAAETRPA